MILYIDEPDKALSFVQSEAIILRTNVVAPIPAAFSAIDVYL